MAEIVKRMLKRGLLKRHRSRFDTRAYVLELTPAGHGALGSAATALDRVEVDLLAAIPQGDRERLVTMLERILAANVQPQG